MADLNDFKKMLEDESLPPEHKKEVMRTIDSLKLIADMVDMFSVKQARVDGNLIANILDGSTESSDSRSLFRGEDETQDDDRQKT
jgi:hypothetical protein